LTIEYPAAEADLEHLFDPAPSGDGGLALAVAHSIVQEHGGFLTALAVGRGECTLIEMLLPVSAADVHERKGALPALGRVPAPISVLLVDPREEVRAELHNFFEAAGFNLLEAADADEAAALAQMHEGALDLVIADSGLAGNLLDSLPPENPAARPVIGALRIVDGPEESRFEMRRPFSGPALVERVRSLCAEHAPEFSAAATSF
jgi:CheY-like chemotaxis protein